jgi:hypothetical protein
MDHVGAATRFTARPATMRSPVSLKRKLDRHFNTPTLHNPALRIIGVLRRTAIRAV